VVGARKQLKRGRLKSKFFSLRSTSTAIPMIIPPNLSTAVIVSLSELPVVRMSSTIRTCSPGAISKSRRKTLTPPSFSAKMLLTPSWWAVSKARIMPPVVGPATTSIFCSSKCWAIRRHSFSVRCGYCKMRNFSQ